MRNKFSGSAERSNGHKKNAVLKGKGRGLDWALGKFSIVVKVQTARGGSSSVEDRRGLCSVCTQWQRQSWSYLRSKRKTWCLEVLPTQLSVILQ